VAQESYFIELKCLFNRNTAGIARNAIAAEIL
jgi:hypothetical protein